MPTLFPHVAFSTAAGPHHLCHAIVTRIFVQGCRLGLFSCTWLRLRQWMQTKSVLSSFFATQSHSLLNNWLELYIVRFIVCSGSWHRSICSLPQGGSHCMSLRTQSCRDN